MNFSRLFKLFFVAAIAFPFCSFISLGYKTKVSVLYVDGTPEISLVNMDHDILVYVNQHRKSIGLKPLGMSEAECSVAAKHSYNMASGKLPFGHKDLKKRMDVIARQVGYISATGENVAYGQMGAKEVVEGWLNSPGHRKNIEGDFTLTGIGVARDKKGMIYYTQIFTK